MTNEILHPSGFTNQTLSSGQGGFDAMVFDEALFDEILPGSPFTNESKSSSAASNESDHSSSFSARTKSSTSATNESKH